MNGDVSRPFDVAADPVDGVSDPLTRHSARTQVSLLPPSCEELTTREPPAAPPG